jgi:hypothetical protein
MEKLRTPSLAGLRNSTTNSGSTTRATTTAALKRAEFLLGQFKGSPDVADPKIYVSSIAAVLSDYPDSVVLRATDPRTGIARKPGQNWHPTVAELAAFCDKLYDPIAREAERQKRITSPDRLLEAPEPAPRKTLAELQAACEARGGLVPRERRGSIVPKKLTEEEIAKAMVAIADYAAKPCGAKASPELLANLEERACGEQ